MKEKLIYFLAKRIATLIIKWRGNVIYYRNAIKKAEYYSRTNNGKRFYIYFIGGKYRILHRKQIQYWRNNTKGVKADLSVSRMTGIQLYDTLGHINSHPVYKQIEMDGLNIIYKSMNSKL